MLFLSMYARAPQHIYAPGFFCCEGVLKETSNMKWVKVNNHFFIIIYRFFFLLQTHMLHKIKFQNNIYNVSL